MHVLVLKDRACKAGFIHLSKLNLLSPPTPRFIRTVGAWDGE